MMNLFKQFFVWLVNISVHKRPLLIKAGTALLVLIVLYGLFIQAPSNFPVRTIVTIEEGASLSEIADRLDDTHVVRSSFLFKLFNVIARNQSRILAGDYYFDEQANLFTVIARISSGEQRLAPIRVTIPEGATILDIADIFSASFDSFDKDAFIELALKKKSEGYLFPDTYYFLPNIDEKKVFETLRDNFDRRIEEISPEIKAFGHSLEDVVIMASLLEKEARQLNTKKMIAGILWERLNIGLALQVDAVFPYIIGKNTFELTLDDLDIDSPYNTYKYPGLPPGPIANPGLDSLLAAVTPTQSDYLFYLSDKEGNMHYSATFEEHKRNKARYLR